MVIFNSNINYNMKKTITLLALAFCLSASAQKKDSLVLQITIDTTTFKSIVQLIQENVPNNTLTGKMVLQNILQPLYNNAKLVADKPKELQNKKP